MSISCHFLERMTPVWLEVCFFFFFCLLRSCLYLLLFKKIVFLFNVKMHIVYEVEKLLLIQAICFMVVV